MSNNLIPRKLELSYPTSRFMGSGFSLSPLPDNKIFAFKSKAIEEDI